MLSIGEVLCMLHLLMSCVFIAGASVVDVTLNRGNEHRRLQKFIELSWCRQSEQGTHFSDVRSRYSVFPHSCCNR